MTTDTVATTIPAPPSIEAVPTCCHCNGALSAGNCYMEHMNDNRKFHIGCLAAASKDNVAMKLLCNVKTWPPRRTILTPKGVLQ